MKLWRKERSLLYTIHPERIPESSAALTYTFGLGGITILAGLVTAITGLALTLYYVPTATEAHESVVLVNDVASFGAVVRGLHYWGGQLMVITATLHLARVVFTGSYRPPRELNWLVGLGLLVVTLIWDFTGYVLRWDDAGHWAVLVGTNLVREVPICGETLYRILVGDVQIGAAVLPRFYGWHVFGLTMIGAFGIFYHLWRLRRDGGISRLALGTAVARTYITRDELFFREVIAATLVTAALILGSVWIPAPLGPAASLTKGVVEAVRAPWIFLWVQDLLRSLPPLWAGIFAPTLILLALASVPFLDRRGPGRGIWLARDRWRPQALFVALSAIVTVLTVLEVLR